MMIESTYLKYISENRNYAGITENLQNFVDEMAFRT
jgi:hypothetical protein